MSTARLESPERGATGLEYREHAFLVDKEALPHPGLDPAALELLVPWAVLVCLLWVGAALALWQMRRHAASVPLPGPRKERGSALVVLGLFVAGLAVRMWGVTTQAESQELTDLLQVVRPQESVADSWLQSLLTLLAPHMVSPHPPLYRLILMLLFQDAHDLAWLRFPSVLAGAATVPVAYLLASRAFGTRAGLLAGLLLCVSPFHVYFSQSISPYALVGLWVVLAYHLHERALAPGGPWGAYVCVLSLGFITHFSVPALYAPLALEALWRFTRGGRSEAETARFWRFFAAGACSLVPFSLASAGLFFYREMIPHIFPMIHAMALFPPVESVGAALGAFFSGAMGFFWHGLMSTFATPEVPLIGACGLALSILGGHHGLKRGHPLALISALAIALFGVFFLALGALTIASNGFFYFASRRFVPIVPFLVIFWAGGAFALHVWLSRRMTPVVGGLALLLFFALPLGLQSERLWRQGSEVVKPDMPALSAALGPALRSGDGVATGPYVFFDFLYSYHADGLIGDWYVAGGAPRWSLLPEEGGGERWVMLSLSDISLPWSQTLEHAGLRRVWLIDIDERPYGLRELEGSGTISHEPLLSAGWRPCEGTGFTAQGVSASCFESPGQWALQDALRVGEGDYRQVMGFAPQAPCAPMHGVCRPEGPPPLPAGR